VNISNPTKAIGIGILGSLFGGILMDIVMFIEFALMGLPLTANLSLVGSVFGGGTSLGVVVHLVTLIVLGSAFSVAVLVIKILRIETVLKGLGMGVLAGIITIPGGCVPFAILSGTPVLEMLSFSTIPHIVWGAALGLVAGYKLRYSSFSSSGGMPISISR
jgi:hypothetical protein